MFVIISAAGFAQSNPVTITYWFCADKPEYSERIQKMEADFSATNGKNITVVAEEYPWDGVAYRLFSNLKMSLKEA